MSTTALLYIIGLAVVVGGAFLAFWLLDARRARGVENDPSRVEQGFDEKQLHRDEEEFHELSTDPRNRMR
ncbi:hypothetical protein [Nocardioides sp. Kera G14]|uniref:hypothetical protein n=1 Tax=Nocardioides sp. Kera G14 TaxID=2884264 RepID=UPI001D11A0BD|nr:hypothetical protein [Nocardioides sp. Kera G14]UDY24660.1 hypothetical protein LH076_04965 [Nocardioides sp. Kera G14]